MAARDLRGRERLDVIHAVPRSYLLGARIRPTSTELLLTEL